MTTNEILGTIRKYIVTYGPWVLRWILGIIVSIITIIRNALRDAIHQILGI